MKTVIKEKVTCTVCWRIMPRLFQCTSGHVLCNLCNAKMTAVGKKCPTCRVAMTTSIRALGLEQIADTLFDDESS